jgi:hypothetical protein
MREEITPDDEILPEGFPVTSGRPLWALASVWSEGVIARYWLMGMLGAETLEAHEYLDVITPGTCLIEIPDARRFVVKLESGRIQGPARVLQIEDLPDEVFGVVRPEPEASTLEDVGEDDLQTPDGQPEIEGGESSPQAEAEVGPADIPPVEDEILEQAMLEQDALRDAIMREEPVDAAPPGEDTVEPGPVEEETPGDSSADPIPTRTPFRAGEGGPVISGPHIQAPVTDDSPPAIGIHCFTGMVGATQLGDGEDLRIQAPATLLIEMPDGLRFVVKMARGHVFGPARVLEVEDIGDAAILSHARARSRAALHGIANGCLAAILAIQVIAILATRAPMPEQAPLAWTALSLMAAVGILLSIRSFRSVEIDDLPGSLGAIFRGVRGLLPGSERRTGASLREVPELPVLR